MGERSYRSTSEPIRSPALSGNSRQRVVLIVSEAKIVEFLGARLPMEIENCYRTMYEYPREL